MASGPRMFLKGAITLEEADQVEEDEDDPVALMNPEKRMYVPPFPQLNNLSNDTSRPLFYESENILGHLYRAIDERKFFDELKHSADKTNVSITDKEPLLQTVWKYVLRETQGIQWEHHREFAEEVRES